MFTMDTQRILAEPVPGKLHLRMLRTSLRQVFTASDDGSFNDLLRRLDEAGDQIIQPEPRPRP